MLFIKFVFPAKCSSSKTLSPATGYTLNTTQSQATETGGSTVGTETTPLPLGTPIASLTAAISPPATMQTPAATNGTSTGSNTYCPSASDLTIAYGSAPKIVNQGWSITGEGGVATKAAYNLLGGSVEYDVDFSGAIAGVNSNIYTISPTISSSTAGYTAADYCDAQKIGSGFCAEIDWIESNGSCGGATTYHTIPGHGSGCTADGCGTKYTYDGKTKFHMKFTYDVNGVMTSYKDGNVLTISPAPLASDWATIKTSYSTKGAVIYSSQWTGWVPTPGSCTSTAGALDSSTYQISNLKVTGSVVQGPPPTKCA